jgi:hypothetical protein
MIAPAHMPRVLDVVVLGAQHATGQPADGTKLFYTTKA